MDEEKARTIAENSDMVVTNRVAYAKFAYTTRHGAIAGKTQVKEVGLYRRVGFTAEGLLCVCDRHLWRELCVCRERRWVGRLKDQLNE